MGTKNIAWETESAIASDFSTDTMEFFAKQGNTTPISGDEITKRNENSFGKLWVAPSVTGFGFPAGIAF